MDSVESFWNAQVIAVMWSVLLNIAMGFALVFKTGFVAQFTYQPAQDKFFNSGITYVQMVQFLGIGLLVFSIEQSRVRVNLL